MKKKRTGYSARQSGLAFDSNQSRRRQKKAKVGRLRSLAQASAWGTPSRNRKFEQPKVRPYPNTVTI